MMGAMFSMVWANSQKARTPRIIPKSSRSVPAYLVVVPAVVAAPVVPASDGLDDVVLFVVMRFLLVERRNDRETYCRDAARACYGGRRRRSRADEHLPGRAGRRRRPAASLNYKCEGSGGGGAGECLCSFALRIPLEYELTRRCSFQRTAELVERLRPQDEAVPALTAKPVLGGGATMALGADPVAVRGGHAREDEQGVALAG